MIPAMSVEVIMLMETDVDGSVVVVVGRLSWAMMNGNDALSIGWVLDCFAGVLPLYNRRTRIAQRNEITILSLYFH
jgi:hypothetical protein